MQIRELKVPGAWEFTPRQFGDDRGLFLEWFKSSQFEKVVGRPLELAQANCSVSAAGVLRGIHFTEDPPGQAKYVTCVRGAFLDVVVDLRPDSPPTAPGTASSSTTSTAARCTCRPASGMRSSRWRTAPR